LGRPIFIRNPQTGYGRIATDYQSQKLQKRIVSACQALRIPAPPEPSRLALNFSGEAILIAWTADESSAPALRGDLDNYTKNIMDGLQRAKMFRNDRHVASFVAARVQLPGPKLTLEEFLSEQLRAAVKESPKASAKSLAPKLGLSVRAVKRLFQHIHEVDTQKAIEKALAATPAAAPIAEQIPAAAGGLDKEGPSPAPAAPSSSSPTELAPTVHPATTKAHAPADQRGRGNARGRRDRSSRTNRRFAGGPVLRTSPILEAGATNFAPISSDESHADAIAGP
jgi:Holliday junction resolvase RusA-like endonuclease